MDLAKLLEALKITGVANNHNNVESNYAYVAIRGNTYNGEDFVPLAIKKGAKLIILAEEAKINDNSVNYFYTPNTRKTLSYLASYFYPLQPNNLVAVTGTNGKTSTAYFYAQIANKLGFNSAAIGTLGTITFSDSVEANNIIANETILTTPDPISIHRELEQLAKQGYEHVAIEASSHGLDQYRLDNLRFKAVGFTNFSRDHLDYHLNLESYFLAKERLFSEIIKENNVAVLNSDIKEYDKLYNKCKQRKIKVLEYGYQAKDLKILSYSNEYVKLELLGKKYEVNLSLPRIQVSNLLCAIGLAIGSGLNLSKILERLNNIKVPEGRLELICSYNGAKIYVDYAHTPDSLETILANFKKEIVDRIKTSNRIPKLHLVFGCGGNRDNGKRSVMGEIAEKLADNIIVTDDNPRYENPQLIREEIIRYCPKAKEIPNRSQAIRTAIRSLAFGDILVIAGKGHENYQIINGVNNKFSDKEEVLLFIKELT